MEKSEILNTVNQYYSDKIKVHGATPAGVDWNSTESQELRFEQLSGIIKQDGFSVLDFGCGFGSLYEYLSKKYLDFRFTGYDISEEMILEAKRQFPPGEKLAWTSDPDLKEHDYIVASGIFNVRNQVGNDDWLRYILQTLDQMNKLSMKGFSFNVLTSYSDEDKKRDYLYYADPLFLFDYCKKNYSKHVALLHDYPIYEFSILVRK